MPYVLSQIVLDCKIAEHIRVICLHHMYKEIFHTTFAINLYLRAKKYKTLCILQ